MKKKNVSRGECWINLIASVAAVGVGFYALQCAEERRIPFTGELLSRSAVPLERAIGLVMIVLGIVYVFRYVRMLRQMDPKGSNRNTGAGGGPSAETHYTCPHCGKKLRVKGGRGRIQVTCPICGHHFFAKR